MFWCRLLQGMELKAKGFKARYLNEYLVKGEAPTDPRGVFKQRSRWCKGQIQVHNASCTHTGFQGRLPR